MSGQEIAELRVPRNIGRNERAAGNDLQPLGPHLFERAADEPGGDALTLERKGDLGVGEGRNSRREAIVRDSDIAVGVHLEAVQFLVVADFAGHAGRRRGTTSCGAHIYWSRTRIASGIMKFLWIALLAFLPAMAMAASPEE